MIESYERLLRTNESMQDVPRWEPRRVSMVGGVGRHFWYLTRDLALGSQEGEVEKNRFSVEFSRNISISDARNRWQAVLLDMALGDWVKA